ncbi:hypothetical protein FRB99_008283 [Tulasnella sp. 403]|nr:hypothetical protein FRB99_008283 [Tulasnella sp. 403]
MMFTPLYLAALVFPLLALAHKPVVVDPTDSNVHYFTVNNGDTGATWTPVASSPDSCDTPQMLTSHLGDYMKFTFTGTGVEVVGTKGAKRGLINFGIDGTNSTVDRTCEHLVCNDVLFKKTGLPHQEHTIIATLIGRQPNLSNGEEDGVLSVQGIKYYY